MGYENVMKILKRLKRYYYTRKVTKRCGSVGSGLKINGKTSVHTNTHLGNNVNFNGMVIHKGGKVTIGDNFHSGNDCLLLPRIHNYQGSKIPYDETYINKEITIDDNVWLGSRVIVLGGVTIGEGAIIQAGSVVVSDIPRCAIAGGHPAKVFSSRDVEHYEKLKEEKKFF